MSVTTAYSPPSYSGDGITSAFPSVFTYQNATDIIVQTLNVSTQAVSTLVLGTDYSVSPTTNSPANTGTVTLTGGALAVGIKLTITRAVPITQLTTWVPNDPNPSTAVQNAVDKLTLIEQQSAYSFGRALTLRPFDINGSGAYDAMHNRITNLGDPIVALDAVNVETMQSYIAGIISTGSGFAPQHYDFTGDGTTVAFPLTGSNLTFASGYRVFYDGVYQRPNIDFTVNGSLIPPVLTFVTAPVFTKANNISVDVIGFAVPINGGLAGLDASVITTGIFNPLRLGNMVPSQSTFLRGDSGWHHTLIGAAGTASPPTDAISLFNAEQNSTAAIRVFAGAGSQASYRLGTKDSGNPWDMQLVYDPGIGAIGWQPFGQPIMGEFYKSGDVQFGNAGLYFARLTNRVGINTAAPQYTLDVSGTVNAINYLGAADASLIQTGVINPLRLGSLPTPGTFLRSDNVWAIPPSTGGGGSATNTSGTFTVAAVGSTQVIPVVSATGFANNQFVYVSDGTHTIYGQITSSGISGLNITVTTTAITGGAAGNTMATGAVFAASASAGLNTFATLNLPYTANANTGVIFFGTTPVVRYQTDGLGRFDTFLGGAGYYGTATDSVAIGNGAFQVATVATSCVAIGNGALSSATTANSCTVVGAGAQAGQTAGSNNVAFGLSAGHLTTTGGGNTHIGTQAGWGVTGAQSNCVSIGFFAGNDATTADGALSIQNIIFGVNNVGTDSTVSSGRIGIGKKLPTHKLDVNGDIRANFGVTSLNYAEDLTALGTVTTLPACDFTLAGTYSFALTPSVACTAGLTAPLVTNTRCSLIVTGATGATLAFSPAIVGTFPQPTIGVRTVYNLRWDGSNFVFESCSVGSATLPVGGTSATFLRGDSTWSPYLLGPVGSIDPAHATMSSQLVSLNDGANQYAALTQTNAGSAIHTRYLSIDGQLIVGNNLTPATSGVIIDSSPPYESFYTPLTMRTAAGVRANSLWARQQIWDPVILSTLPISASGGGYAITRNFSGNTVIQINDGTQTPTSGTGFTTAFCVEVVSPGANAITFSDGGGGSITWLSGTFTAPASSGSTVYRFTKRQGISGWLGEQLNSSGGTYTNAQAQDAVGGILSATSTIAPTYTAHSSIAMNVVAGSIGNTQLASGISASKLASYPGNAALFLNGAGAWTTPSAGSGSNIQFQQAGSNVGAAGAFTTYNFLSGLNVGASGATVQISPDRTVLQSYINWQIAGVTQNSPTFPITTVNFASGVTGTGSGNTLTLNITGGGSGISPGSRNTFTAPQTFSVGSFPASAPYGTINATSTVMVNDYYPNTSPDGAAGIKVTSQNNDTGGNYQALNLYQQNNASSVNVTLKSWSKSQHVSNTGFNVSNYFVNETSNMAAGQSVSDVLYPNSWGPCIAFASTPDATGVTHSFGTGGHVRIGEMNYGNAWADFGFYNTLPVGGSKVSGLSFFPDWLPGTTGAVYSSTPIFHASFAIIIGQSGPHSGGTAKNWTGILIDQDGIVPSGLGINVHGGSASGNATFAAIQIQDYHNTGINFAGGSPGGVSTSAATFTSTGGAAITLADQTQSIKLGSVWLRGNAGALQISTNGTSWTTITIP